MANPVHSQRAASDLDLVYVGTEHDVIMIEGDAKEVPEADFVAARLRARSGRPPYPGAKELAAAGKPKRQAELFVVPDEPLEIAYRVAGDRIEAALLYAEQGRSPKGCPSPEEEVSAAILESSQAHKIRGQPGFDYLQRRPSSEHSRQADPLRRPRIRSDPAPERGDRLLPRAHGSALFQRRGETQAVRSGDLAPADEAQELDGAAPAARPASDSFCITIFLLA